MLPMKPDLQQLIINDFECQYPAEKYRYQFRFSSVFCLDYTDPLSKFLGKYEKYVWGYMPIKRTFIQSLRVYITRFILLFFIIPPYILFFKIPYFFILKWKYKNLLLLLKQVDKHNQIIENIHVSDQLAEAGNSIEISDREAVIEALKITRDGLIRALKTERILRENPKFRPEYFNIDLTTLEAERTTVKAMEYAELLNDALQIGVSVQTEMRKLQNKR